MARLSFNDIEKYTSEVSQHKQKIKKKPKKSNIYRRKDDNDENISKQFKKNN